MRLNPKHFSLNEMLQGRLFRIPDYQRAYSWQSKQRDDLFRDIRTAMETGQDHFMATVVGLGRGAKSIGADEYTKVEIVDGQQRLTTIIILLKAIEKALDDGLEDEEKVKKEISSLLIKGDDHSLILLQTNHDSSRIFINYIREGTLPSEAPKTAAEKNLADAAEECEKFVEEFQDSESKIRLIGTLRNRLTMLFHEVGDEAVVYRVFEVLNSRGLEVKWIDKLKSQLMALIFEHADDGARDDALGEMRTVWSDIYRTLGLRNRLGDEAVRFAGTYKSVVKPNKILKDESAVQELVNAAGTDLRSIVDLAVWLKSVVSAVDQLDSDNRKSAVTQIVHARLLAVSIMLRDATKDERDNLLHIWENVTFRIFGLGRADSRNKVGDHVRLAYSIEHNKPQAAEIKAELRALADGFGIDTVIEKGNWIDCYNNWTQELRYLLYRYDEHLAKKNGTVLNFTEWNKIWETETSRSVEHIQPQSSKADYIHHLGNLTMLPPGVNSSLKAKPPVEKAATYVTCGLKGTAEVGSGIQVSKEWTEDDVTARTETLLEFLKQEWGD